jgi:hypothetical protein
MKLNCKPGDLAVVLKTRMRPDAVGMVVRVVEHTVVGGEPAWRIDPPLPGGVRWSFAGGSWTDGTSIRDECLRPIRDPGEDAVDEILQLVGSPNKVAA